MTFAYTYMCICLRVKNAHAWVLGRRREWVDLLCLFILASVEAKV